MADTIKELTFSARHKLKYDLYTSWSTNNPVLLEGEVAFAYIPENQTLNENGVLVTGTTPPHVMLKVGDGTHHYNDLKFASALAADVSEWAKATVKPEYKASEIKELDTFISTAIQDTNTEYSLVKVNAYQYKLMSKTIGEENFTTEVAVLDIPQYDDSGLNERITANTTAITTLNGAVTEAGSVAKSIADAIAALKLSETYAAIVHGHTITDVTGLTEALAGKETSGAAAQALIDAKAYADGKDASILAAQQAAEKAQTDIDNLAELVGTAPADAGDTTVFEFIGAETTRATNRENEIEGALNTYKSNNDGRVEAVEKEVDTLQTQIGGLTGAMHFEGVVDAVPANGAEGYEKGDVVVVSTTHKEYVYDGTSWYELGDEGSYLTKTEASTTYETKADAEAKLGQAKSYTDEKATAAATDATNKANQALADAKTYADGIKTNLQGQIDPIAAKPAMGITNENIGSWNTAAEKAGTAIQSVETTDGLTATVADNKVTIGFDTSVVFIFDCGDSSNI